MKYEVKKVDIWSLAKFLAMWGIVVGLIIGILTAIVFLAIPSSYTGYGTISWTGFMPNMAAVGTLAVVVYPIVMAICGLIGGLVTGVIYNFVAGWVGGIQVELTEGTVMVPESQARKTPRK